MSVTVSLMDEAPASDWDSFVRSHPQGTFFHLSGWKRIIEQVYGHPCPYLEARRGGALVGVLPLVGVASRLFGRSLVSTGFCVRGGSLALDEAALQALDSEAERLLEKGAYRCLEYRAPAEADASWRADWAAKQDLYFNFARTLEGDESARLKQIPRKQRAVVRKALANETLSWVIDPDTERFYKLYARRQRDLGTPVPPIRFFAALKILFGADCEVLTVEAAGEPVASVLSFYHGSAVLPYYTGGTASARALGANDLMYWGVMERAADRATQTEAPAVFDFGRSKAQTGPFAFKKNWGFEAEPLTHLFRLKPGEEIPEVNPLNPKYQLFIKAWKRLPLPVANTVGPFLVRSLP